MRADGQIDLSAEERAKAAMVEVRGTLMCPFRLPDRKSKDATSSFPEQNQIHGLSAESPCVMPVCFTFTAEVEKSTFAVAWQASYQAGILAVAGPRPKNDAPRFPGARVTSD